MSRIFLQSYNFFFLKNFSKKINVGANIFIKSFFTNISIYSDFFFFLNYEFIFFDRIIFFKNIFIIFFKNFFNAFNNLLNYNYNFLVLDTEFNFFNPVTFFNNNFFKYNSFFKISLKYFKKQKFFLSLKKFIRFSNVKAVFLIDYDYFNNYIYLLSFLNVYLFSFIYFTNNPLVLDFFIFKSVFFKNFEKYVYLSFIYKMYFNVKQNKLKNFKYFYLQNLIK